MKRQIEQLVRRRAGEVCEYCRLPEVYSHLPFSIDHIIAKQHGGGSIADNLALACPECNLHKGPNLAGIDPATQKLTRLFHPRDDSWSRHFRWQGAKLAGKTPIGRTTIIVLAVNMPTRVALRLALIEAGLFPMEPS